MSAIMQETLLYIDVFAKLLSENKKEAKALNKEKKTDLHLTSRYGNLEMVQLLVDYKVL